MKRQRRSGAGAALSRQRTIPSSYSVRSPISRPLWPKLLLVKSPSTACFTEASEEPGLEKRDTEKLKAGDSTTNSAEIGGLDQTVDVGRPKFEIVAAGLDKCLGRTRHSTGEPLIVLDRQKDMRWSPPIGDEHGSPLCRFLCAADILINSRPVRVTDILPPSQYKP